MNNRLRNTRGNTGKGMINGRNRRTPQWRGEGREREEGREGKKGDPVFPVLAISI